MSMVAVEDAPRVDSAEALFANGFAREVEENESTPVVDSDFQEEESSKASKVSEARLASNRQNALKSTGPKTEEGKKRSRENALTHGLSGAGVVRIEEDEEAFQAEVARWTADLKATTALDKSMIETMVIAQTRMHRAYEMEVRMLRTKSRRALDAWEEDRRIEAINTARSLSKTPEFTLARLRQSRQGCDWLMERWIDLEQALEVHGEWNEEQTALTLDLLGVPTGFRNSTNRLPRNATLERKREIVAEAFDGLEEMRTKALIGLDRYDREQAIKGTSFDDSLAAERLRRLDRANTRVYLKMLDALTARAQATSSSSPSSVPSSTTVQPTVKQTKARDADSPLAIPAALARLLDSIPSIVPPAPTPSAIAPARSILEPSADFRSTAAVTSPARESRRARKERRRREAKKPG